MTDARFAMMWSVLLLMCAAAGAQEIGTVAALEGTAEIGRDGTWTPATTGAAVHQSDQLRTGRPGRLRVVFQDDSVLTLSDDSQTAVDQVVDTRQAAGRSLIGLLHGKVSALVSDYYHRAGTAYEIKTVTAVAGVRGTEFEVTYDPVTAVTDVLGISGTVEVRSQADPTAPGVLVRASETSSVAPGALPTRPRRLEDTLFRQQLEGIEFIGAGRAESLTVDHPLRTGATIAPPDRAPATGPSPLGSVQRLQEQRDASGLVGDSPPILRNMRGQLGIEF